MIYDEKSIEQIKNYLLSNHLTIAVAESVTSGHIQAALSTATDARKFFQGGITAYNIGQKSRHLIIEPTHAIECNCVSGQVAETMASNICKMFVSDIGIALTGYAAPVPERGIEQLFAWLSIVKQGKVVLTRKITTE